jgi:hypothetical protein
MEVGIDLKTPSGWTSLVASGASAEVAIPEFGFRCFVSDLYEGTPLAPRPTAHGGRSFVAAGFDRLVGGRIEVDGRAAASGRAVIGH